MLERSSQSAGRARPVMLEVLSAATRMIGRVAPVMGVVACLAATVRAQPPRDVLFRLDDAGLNRSVNDAIERVVKTGVPVSVSLLVMAPEYEHAVAMLRRYPSVAVGVHLALNSEWRSPRWGPVLGVRGAPSLVDAQGYFLPSTVTFVSSGFDTLEVERELDAQVARAIASGLDISYVDSHMTTLEARPELRRIQERVARKHGLLVSKAVGERYFTLWPVPPESKQSALLDRLARLDSGAVTVIAVHVADRTPEMAALVDLNEPEQNRGNGVGEHRSAELAAMLSPPLAERIRSGGIRLVTYADLARRGGLIRGR